MLKALVLCAGAGTRLRPLTDDRPKAMVELAGEPAIAHVLRWLHAQRIAEVAINLHHRPDMLQRYVGDGSRFGLRVRYSLEEEILGTAGALRPLRDFLGQERLFLVVYGDVLTDLAVDPMRAAHEANGADLTIAVSQTADPTSSGVIGFDPSGRIDRFVEKPEAHEVFSPWANGGVYLSSPVVYEHIGRAGFQDFGRDVLPAMITSGRRLMAHVSGATFHDVGTPERLAWAAAWLEDRRRKPTRV